MPEGRKQLGRPGRKREEYIKMDITEAGSEGVDWISLAQDRHKWRALANAVIKLQFPHKMMGISRLVGKLFATEGFCNMASV